MQERGMENDPRYQQLLALARMNGLQNIPGMPGMQPPVMGGTGKLVALLWYLFQQN